VSGSNPALRDDIDRVFTPAVSRVVETLDRLEAIAKHGTGDQSPHGRKGGGKGPEEKDPKKRPKGAPQGADREMKVRYARARTQLRKDLLEIDRLSTPPADGKLAGEHVGKIEEAQLRAGELIAFMRGEMD